MVNNCLFFDQLFGWCPLCGGRSPDSLCPACKEELPWLTNNCRRCAIPLSMDHSTLCGPCQHRPPPYHTTCLFHYQYPINQLITGLKYRQQLQYGRLLGNLLAEKLNEPGYNQDLPEAIIPVPLHRKRLYHRGYNQSYEIARYCAKSLSLPLLDRACQRIVNTPPQSGLKAATRRQNLRGAFLAGATLNVRSVAIVDDVITTGSTVTELAHTLFRAGVQEIQIWCIARTGIE